MNEFLLACSIVTFLSICLLLLTVQTLRFSHVSNQEDRLFIRFSSLFPGFIACILQGMLLSQLLWIDVDHLNINLSNALLICAFIGTLLCLVIGIALPIMQVLFISVIINIFAVIFAVFIPTTASILRLSSASLQAHILLSICAYSILAFASLIAILFAIKDWQIKQHRLSTLWKAIPSLQSLERLLFHLLHIGFLLLTIGIVTGFVDLENWLTHKVIFSIIAWLVFASLLLGRYLWGWRGKRAVKLALTGMVFLLLAFFGSKFVIEVIL